MSENINETEELTRSTSAQDAVIDEVDDAMKRLRISPRKALESLSHLRIERARIEPIGGQTPKAGGQGDVEAAILVPTQTSNSSGPDDLKYVAVKKLRFDEDTDDDRTLAPLAYEVGLLNDLSHKNVIKIIGFVEEAEQGIGWMVFAWEKNGNLREFIRSANWELPERVSLIGDVANGLSYLHERSPPICQGDLKSLNILISSKNLALIADFSSARTVGSVEQGALEGVRTAKATSTLQPAGTGADSGEEVIPEIAPSGEFITMTGPGWTVRWAAPELLEGHFPGLASDIWALGWICWEAVTGNFPFDKENDVAVALHITKGDLPAIENDDQLKQIKTLCSLMRECWRLVPTERPTALRCQKLVTLLDQSIPSRMEGDGSIVTRSSGLLFALGWVQLRNDMYPEAQGYFEQSLRVAGSVGDEGSRARALKAIGDTFLLRDEHSKAEVSYIQARDIYTQIADRLGFAQSVKGLGDVYQVRNEYSKAEETYIQARDIYSQTGTQLGVAQSVKSLGDVYRMRGEHFKAEESYIQARDVYSQVGDQLGLAQSVKGVGDAYYMRAEDSMAEEAYIQAREIYSQIGDQLGFAQAVKGLGDVYYMCNEYSKAEEAYTQARDIYSQINNQLGLAQSVDGLGDVYRSRSEYSKAEESYIEARDIYSQVGNQLGLAQSFEGMGHVHSSRREHAKAEESYSEAQRIYQEIGDMWSFANISRYLAWLHRDQAQYGVAERLVREACTIYTGLGLTREMEDCNKFLEDIRRLI